MLSHRAIWEALDSLADRHGLSASGLAKLAGLDATAFNPSKRVSKDGRERWPSTESVAKVLEATSETFDSLLSFPRRFSSLLFSSRIFPPRPSSSLLFLRLLSSSLFYCHSCEGNN